MKTALTAVASLVLMMRRRRALRGEETTSHVVKFQHTPQKETIMAATTGRDEPEGVSL